VATLTFQIPDNRMQDLIDAWTAGWPAVITDGVVNTQAQTQYAKNNIKREIINRVQEYLAEQQPDFPIT